MEIYFLIMVFFYKEPINYSSNKDTKPDIEIYNNRKRELNNIPKKFI